MTGSLKYYVSMALLVVVGCTPDQLSLDELPAVRVVQHHITEKHLVVTVEVSNQTGHAIWLSKRHGLKTNYAETTSAGGAVDGYGLSNSLATPEVELGSEESKTVVLKYVKPWRWQSADVFLRVSKTRASRPSFAKPARILAPVGPQDL